MFFQLRRLCYVYLFLMALAKALPRTLPRQELDHIDDSGFAQLPSTVSCVGLRHPATAGAKLENDSSCLDHLSPAIASPSDYERHEAVIKSTYTRRLISERQLHPLDRSLHFKSSTRSIKGVHGYLLHTFLIAIRELRELLSGAQNDLRRNYSPTKRTSSYRYVSSRWTFQVLVSNTTIHYMTISEVVLHLIRLTPRNSLLISNTWTRFGCVLNGTIPVADVIILPRNSDFASLFAHFPPKPHDPDLPNKVLTITPTDVTDALLPDPLDASALGLYGSLPPLQSGPLVAPEVFVPVAHTAYLLSVGLLRPDALATFAIRASVGYSLIVISLALTRLAVGFASTISAENNIYAATGETELPSFLVESGEYRLGALAARFVMESLLTDEDGHRMGLGSAIYTAVAEALLNTLRNNGSPLAYAVEGNILHKTSNGSLEVVGRWELPIDRVGDSMTTMQIP